MRRTIWGSYLGLLVTLLSLASLGGFLFFDKTGPSDAIEAAADRHAYNILSWELRQFPGKWLYKAGRLFQNRGQVQEEDILREYFTLAREAQRLEQEGDIASLHAIEEQCGKIKVAVQDILAGRVTEVLKEQGLAIEPPLFTDLNIVFPPVDFEISSPPRVLAISPRDRIDLERSYLLAPGLDPATVQEIETQAESAKMANGEEVSALVIPLGGVALYPSVVPDSRSYENLVEIIIHEWLHQYLVMFPLGQSYFSGGASRTLNETVASIGGRELVLLFVEKYPSPLPPVETRPAEDGQGFDFNSEMRALRLQVDELLAAGLVHDAEALMDRKRDEFEANGVYIRRINQAYFAFHGSYADTPASVDPIGPKLQELLNRAGSPGQFVRLASGLTNLDGLDRLLAGP